ncbi:MAG: signal peptide peptidase SppA [Thermoflexales bacterium]|nr:signal peptide peptidase SppA [Thermoflexales bacterium]MCS7324952.1 signal peptide peptidase SppA [Thermoflexales bacterium]MCX7938689.1 signal peptide peptidase SppA [Thermoflexales bacterium]MDW8054287.1 signal peptide peptidase SppA [Anaerolineae bacterium]MDW8291551.1 signal peptide peptidase SppA [Anaerolineae bacterium]
MSNQNGSRSAAWALAGVLVGFALPVCLCACVAVAPFALLSASLPAATAAATPFGTAATSVERVQISGPASGPAVAVVSINGPIVSGSSNQFDFTGIPVAASRDVIRVLEEVAKDGDVRALVLFVDSPGGSVVGSDEIYHALKTKVRVPIVVYMGNTAASGGYYVSMAGQHIIAHPNTLTGSIGVISEFTNIEGLYEKLGLKSVVLKSGEFKDFGNPTSPFTEEDRKLWQAVLDEIYEQFVRIVAEGRRLSVERVKTLADGRPYTGKQALEAGLVDQLGYFEDAVDKAAELGGITGEPRVVEYRKRTPLSSLLGIRLLRSVLLALGVPESAMIQPRGLQYR